MNERDARAIEAVFRSFKKTNDALVRHYGSERLRQTDEELHGMAVSAVLITRECDASGIETEGGNAVPSRSDESPTTAGGDAQ
jgi:hypothetical protein